MTLQWEAKLLLPLKKKVCVNDRIFCSPDTLGYEVLGHTEASSMLGILISILLDNNRPPIHTDDLGSKYLLRHFGYFELNNLWKMKEVMPLFYW